MLINTIIIINRSSETWRLGELGDNSKKDLQDGLKEKPLNGSNVRVCVQAEKARLVYELTVYVLYSELFISVTRH